MQKRILGALCALMLAASTLLVIPGPSAEAVVSSPSDCSLANGYYTLQWAGYGYWWTSNAETTTNYWNATGTAPRNPMVNACVRWGYAPTWSVGFYYDSHTGTPATSDTAWYHYGDGRAYDRRSAYCSVSWNHCASWTSWHKEEFGWVQSNIFVYYNF